jgi:hypothetical protein
MREISAVAAKVGNSSGAIVAEFASQRVSRWKGFGEGRLSN